MESLEINKGEMQITKRSKEFVSLLKEISATEPQSVDETLNLLRKLRQDIYENMNQIQHDAMILKAAKLLQKNHDFSNMDIVWYWNPSQKGSGEEPDLRGVVLGRTIISAEITTSENPIGSIDSRIRDTLDKLSQMDGGKYYFVRTSQMEQRAKTKVNKSGFPIEVILIEA